MKNKKNQKGFVLVFTIAVVSALSIMTGAMFFYYDNDLKSVSRNSVMQQVNLAAETGLQEGQKWITDQLNSNSFSLVDIQNNLYEDVDDPENKCLNRHGYVTGNDVYYAKKIVDDLGDDVKKFEDISYEVYVQRHADVVRSIYFSEQGSKGGADKDTTYSDRSFALVEKFKDFPTDQFTIEMWIKNMQTTDTYNMHAFEWGREWDLVFKVQNDTWSPRLGEVVLDDQGDVGTPVKDEWVHIAWVWDGGDPSSNDTGNVRIYQNGTLTGTFNANIGARAKSGYTNPPETLPEGDHWPLAIGEGLHGFSPNSYLSGDVLMQSVPWKGNISEMRIWNISRTEDDIANNNRRRLSGSEPGLVSYYKFNEGSGNIAKDFNTSRGADRRNDATIYGIGNKGTLWKTELVKYPVEAVNGILPAINVPPGEDVVYYKILSCGNGPQGQIVPLELIVSAPVQKGDVGDGKIALTSEDVNDLTGQEASPLKIPLSNYIGQEGVAGDIKIQLKNNSNTNFYVFKRSMEQCNNATTFTLFDPDLSYNEGDCAEFEDKLYYLEKDDGKAADADFSEDDWSEVLGSGCDGVQFTTNSGNSSYGHYYKYFSTAPNVTSGNGGDLGYNRDSIDWWEAKRRAEASTCGGMRGYLVSIDSAQENEFIKDAVMCDASTDNGCSGVTPFHVAAGETRANYYGVRLDAKTDQHYVWLSNSDWRLPTGNAANMQSESGPNMGESNGYTNWQSGEPNSSAEPYADMEINRANRVNGKWNDLRRIPNCSDTGLDCITGYVVEYGGFDSLRLRYNHNPTEDNDFTDDDDVDLENAKVCIARATIEKDTYVAGEDFLTYDDEAEDAPSDISADTSATVDADTTDDDSYDGWNENTGVLTLVHDDKPADWGTDNNYTNGSFVWYNNRVWKNISGGTITGGASLEISQTPTLYNPEVWKFYDGTEPDAPCSDADEWMQAFESIKYYNALEVDPDSETNPFAYEEGGDAVLEDEDNTVNASLGERSILFSLGPLHIEEHRDGYNHFYEFYEFPRRASGNSNNDIFNDKNRRMNESFSLANKLSYFGKRAYLATVTSAAENDIITEKAVGNGWFGGIGQNTDQDDPDDLDKCGGIIERINPNYNRITAREDANALLRFDEMDIYSSGEDYTAGSGAVTNPNPSGSPAGQVTYIRNIIEKYRNNSMATTPIEISDISTDDAGEVTTDGNHGLVDDDIIRLEVKSDRTAKELVDMSDLKTGYYRVVRIDNDEFRLVDLDTRRTIDTTSFDDYTTDADDRAQIYEIEGIQNEFYRLEGNITDADPDPREEDDNLVLFWKDPKIALENKNAISGNSTREYFDQLTPVSVTDTITNECSVWRWVTGPEQFLGGNIGLAFAPSRTATDTPSANNGTWTRSNPSGQQIGEVFEDGMPFRSWNGTGEPNNVSSTEHGIHMLGTHFAVGTQLTWNDLHNWNAGPNDNDNYSIRGMILEYGGMENDDDPIIRIATKRVINLYDRRVTKAVVKIKSGAQSGDKLVAGSAELTEVAITATNNETSTVTLTGDATCKNYLDLIQSMDFEHNGSSEGIREIEVQIGDVKKPAGASHYYQLNDDSQLSYDQANFQASYANLCGIQGYLANVTTTADYDAISDLGITVNKQAWVNGTDECQGGLYRSGFWRYTSGPWKDKEFWRVRIDSTLDIENVAACNETNLRDDESSVRVGPFTSTNWVANHPAANDNDYLAFQKTASGTTTGIVTRTGAANASVEGFIIRFGGSVGDFTGADIEEDGNNIDIVKGPIRAEISFYTDGSDNSIYVDDEDTVAVKTTGDGALSTGWSRAATFVGASNSPLKITPPTGEAVTIAQWRNELEKVYYQNTDTSDFTPGNRKIKIKLVYSNSSLNQEIGTVKTIGSRNAITVTPISWNNR